jgi:peptide deformylase
MLEILKFPDPRLKEKSLPVTEFNAELHRLLDQMAETMYSANGIGLAAPQVGKTLRAFVIDIGAQEGEIRKLHEFINPRLSNGQGKISFEEGCLSVPGFTEEVQRKSAITVHFQDRDGEPQVMQAEKLLAVAIQHENDHLEGVLFVDRLSPLKRRFAKRKLERSVTL